MDAKEYKEMMVQTRGEFGGLGMQVTMENGLVKVVSPIDDTPAAKAGMKPNDLILAIDDAPVTDMTLEEAVDKLRGAGRHARSSSPCAAPRPIRSSSPSPAPTSRSIR